MAQIPGKHSYSVVGSNENHNINSIVNGRASNSVNHGRVQKRKIDSAGEASVASSNSTDSDSSVIGGVGSAKKVSPKRRRLSRQTPIRASSINGNCSSSAATVARLTPTKARRDLSDLVTSDHDTLSKPPSYTAASLKDVVDAGAVFRQQPAVMSATTALKSCVDISAKNGLLLDLDNKKSTELTGHDSGFSSGGSQDMSPTSDGYPSQTTSVLDSQETITTDSTQKSDGEEKTYEVKPLSATSSNASDIMSAESSTEGKPMYTGSDNETCKICSNSTKEAVFVHTNKACSGCCYSCALKVWKKWKTCPFCKLKPKNVMKLFSH